MNAHEGVGVLVNPFSEDRYEVHETRSQKIKRIATKRSIDLKKALRLYDKLELGVKYWHQLDVLKGKMPEFKPEAIDMLLQEIKDNYPAEKVSDHITGRFLSDLITLSFYAGHNDFVLNTQDTLIADLPYNLSGRSSIQPLRYTVFGYSGEVREIEYCNGTHHGDICTRFNLNVGPKCHMAIYGDAVDFAANNCLDSDVHFYGKVGHRAAYLASNSRITFYSSIGSEAGEVAHDCEFRAVLEDTFNWLCSSVTKNRFNTVQQIDENGRAIKEVKL